MERKRTIIGNWKMQGSQNHVEAFFAELAVSPIKKSASSQLRAAICPPFIYLSQAAHLLEQVSFCELGAQDVSEFTTGAYTGQISAQMLKEQGCHYVIVGHSERRQYCHESDQSIANKFFAAKAAGLTPILCVGETKAQREADITSEIVIGQLQAILDRGGGSSFKGAILAYEPIWAIGTGLTATPDQARQVHSLLRLRLAEYDAMVATALPILYGGSVKPDNAKDLFRTPDIDGALVGGAAFQAKDFLAICEAGLV